MMRLLTLPLLLLVALAANAENFVSNSSFELGMRRGWWVYDEQFGVAYGNNYLSAEQISSESSVHGTKSAAWESRFVSRPTWLTQGVYTLTFSAKITNGAMALQYEVTLPYRQFNPAAWTNTANLTTSWQRFTNRFQIFSNAFYICSFYGSSGNNVITFTDGVMIQSGTTASDYAPMSQVEVGVDTEDPGNILYDANNRVARFTFYNNGSATEKTVHYDLLSLWNSNLNATATFTTNVPSGTSTLGITLPAYGYIRPTCYIVGQDDSWDECSIYNARGPVDMTSNTNHILGLHTHYSPSHIEHNRRAGFGLNRLFSPITQARWETVHAGGVVTNYTITNIVATMTNRSLIPFVCFTDGSQVIPSWATNGGRTSILTNYSNYVRGVVSVLSVLPYGVKLYEIWNEPNNEASIGHFFDMATYPTNYADLLTMGAGAVKSACADCRVIGFGGQASPSTYSIIVWTNLSATTKSQIDYLSAHIYPPEGGNYYRNPNAEDNDYEHFVSVYEWYTWMSTNKPLWNTETANTSYGSQKGQNVAYDYGGYWRRPPGTVLNEAERQRWNVADIFSVDKYLKNFIECLGYGFTHYNLQYGRRRDVLEFQSNYGVFPNIQEKDGSLKPEIVALLTASYFVRNAGLGRVTNINHAKVEAYLFTNSMHGVVVPILNYDRLNRTLTFTNGLFAVYDAMGNLVQTNNNVVTVGRTVRYLVSGVLNTNAMRNIVSNAAVAAVADTLPPNVSIDMSPIGDLTQLTTRTNIFKWTAIDDSVVVSDGDPAAYSVIQSKWRFQSSEAFNTYSTSNHCYRVFSTPGTYRLEVVAKDATGNESASFFGPTFTISGSAVPRYRLRLRFREPQ